MHKYGMKIYIEFFVSSGGTNSICHGKCLVPNDVIQLEFMVLLLSWRTVKRSSWRLPHCIDKVLKFIVKGITLMNTKKFGYFVQGLSVVIT